MTTEIREIKAEGTWPMRHKVMWPDQPLDYVILPQDEEGLHYGLFKEGKLISVISLFIDMEEAQFRKFATATEAQGNGYGSALLFHLLETAKKLGMKRIWCNARTDKASYYERFGLSKTHQHFKKGGIDYVIMERYF